MATISKENNIPMDSAVLAGMRRRMAMAPGPR